MDRKSKKRLEVLQKKRTKLRNELSVVRKFTDDPAEIPRLEAELKAVEDEIEQIKGS